MSETEETITSEGIRVDRTRSERDSGVTVRYEVESDGDEPVEFRVTETVTEAYEEAGFHPQHEPDEWSVEDEEIAFQGIAPPEGSYDTVLGIVPEEKRALGTEPTVKRVRGGDSLLGRLGTRLFGNGDGENGPAGDASVIAAPPAEDAGDSSPDGTHGESNATADGGQPSAAVDTEDGTSEDPADLEAGTRTPAEEENQPAADQDDAGGEETVQKLVEALEDDDHRTAVREALGVEAAPSERVHVEHLQSRVSELDAYAETLETAIDRHGPPAEFMDDIRDDLHTLHGDVADLEDATEEAAEERADMQTDLTDLKDVTEEAAEERADIQAGLDDLEDATEKATEERADMQTDLTDLEDATEKATEERDAMQADLDELDEAVAAFEETVADLRRAHERRLDTVETDVDAVAEDVRTLRADLEADIESLHEATDDLVAMREALSTAIGGVPAGGTGTDDDGTQPR